ncbi:STAS domain-containing protein [Agaribacterium haliotis]|uniref:STAS domain-containing protein n=1 Tax=Agaribacterium haliotis TaxID=2013869 RepID=UPI000BB5599A|nr:STAS domain-containing protein [Agaribacterium haliotis]
MNTGEIKVADKDGVFVIKMLGDVRLTLSLSFDEFIDQMFASEDFSSVIFDLTEAEAIDSTTLGLMAKISLKGRALHYMDPIVISSNAAIIRLLDSMGFAEILQIVESADIGHDDFQVLHSHDLAVDEEAVRQKVLEAHRSLVELNADNKEVFKELLHSLERG